MLHRESVSPELLGLIEAMMSRESFRDMRLVGGTALALQLGHRISLDIDLFGTNELRKEELLPSLRELGHVEQIGSGRSTLAVFVNGIKVDVVSYPYPWLDPVVDLENIRMASLRDISAMKIAAITNRGSRKDFVDLYFLLERFSLNEILANYKARINDGNEWMALRSLVYFEDAELQPMPEVFQDLSWDAVKRRISAAVKEF